MRGPMKSHQFQFWWCQSTRAAAYFPYQCPATNSSTGYFQVSEKEPDLSSRTRRRKVDDIDMITSSNTFFRAILKVFPASICAPMIEYQILSNLTHYRHP
ncbi:hypothetical protein TWF102_002869 [Orbilia oligospora]|uniref:Uncharacterized protein n=1 Tax=Orbilia oligospora TaxID=2813651 RepID=A0A7C8J5I1_ORBOL|nr:hypothetical protein TWF102_002869 [Orbilia oligospora]KAF3098425.1 hypothetical protein TWF706_006854 [Orbilia oligospora]